MILGVDTAYNSRRNFHRSGRGTYYRSNLPEGSYFNSLGALRSRQVMGQNSNPSFPHIEGQDNWKLSLGFGIGLEIIRRIRQL